MYVKFGVHFNGLQPQRPMNATGVVTVGPVGLLAVLETHLGLPPLVAHPSEAAFAYLQCLRDASAPSPSLPTSMRHLHPLELLWGGGDENRWSQRENRWH